MIFPVIIWVNKEYKVLGFLKGKCWSSSKSILQPFLLSTGSLIKATARFVLQTIKGRH